MLALTGCGLYDAPCTQRLGLSTSIGSGYVPSPETAAAICAASDRGDVKAAVELVHRVEAGDPTLIAVGAVGVAGQIAAARAALNRQGGCENGTCGIKAGVGVAEYRGYTSVRAVCPHCQARAGSDTGPGVGGTQWERLVVAPGGPGGHGKSVIEIGKPAGPNAAGRAQSEATGLATMRAYFRDNADPTR